MKLATILALLFSMTTIVGNQTSAQPTSCPINFVCIEHEGVTLEIDPECGVVQTLVTEENLARTTTLTGVKESFGLRGIVVAQDGGKYTVIGEFSGPAVDTLEDVRFGSVGCIEWIDSDE